MLHEPGLRPITVVLVDDEVLGLTMLGELIASVPGMFPLCFTDPVEALAWCRGNQPEIVITDYEMPRLTGIDLIRELRRQPQTREIPIMMLTGSSDRVVRYQALELGANDFLTKPIDALEVKARAKNMLAIRRGQRALLQRTQVLEEEVLRATEAVYAREYETIFRLARAAEYRDWETGAHIVRVSWYARIIAQHLGLAESEAEMIFRAAPMHDVGKIGIPDHILLKPSGLDDHEFATMKQHTTIGHGILSGSSSELLCLAGAIALSHHERYDGLGYPEGRRGEQIPLAGRIVAVADTYDALTSNRPYKHEWPAEQAWSFLQDNAGVRFDRDCVSAFRNGLEDIAQVRASFPDGTAPPLPAGDLPGLPQTSVTCMESGIVPAMIGSSRPAHQRATGTENPVPMRR